MSLRMSLFIRKAGNWDLCHKRCRLLATLAQDRRIMTRWFLRRSAPTNSSKLFCQSHWASSFPKQARPSNHFLSNLLSSWTRSRSSRKHRYVSIVLAGNERGWQMFNASDKGDWLRNESSGFTPYPRSSRHISDLWFIAAYWIVRKMSVYKCLQVRLTWSRECPSAVRKNGWRAPELISSWSCRTLPSHMIS